MKRIESLLERRDIELKAEAEKYKLEQETLILKETKRVSDNRYLLLFSIFGGAAVGGFIGAILGFCKGCNSYTSTTHYTTGYYHTKPASEIVKYIPESLLQLAIIGTIIGVIIGLANRKW